MVADDTSELDEENEKAVQAAKRVRREHVWREMVLSSNGRDKAFVRMVTPTLFALLANLSLFFSSFPLLDGDI
jgi:hypothetical protein